MPRRAKSVETHWEQRVEQDRGRLAEGGADLAAKVEVAIQFCESC